MVVSFIDAIDFLTDKANLSQSIDVLINSL